MSNPVFKDSILLLGDSLTEPWAAGALGQRLAEYYRRTLDVVNRGYGGYNTEWILPVFKRTFATRADAEQGKAQPVKLVTIWLGANDCVIPGDFQHVPLDRYKSNLSKLISWIRSPSSEYYSPDTAIIMITPPPVIDEKWFKAMQKLQAERGQEVSQQHTRTSERAHTYAKACLEVAEGEQVQCIDMYSGLIEAAGGSDLEHLDAYLSDGLHFTSLAYEVLFEKLVAMIEKEFPKLNPMSLSVDVPLWYTLDPVKPEALESTGDTQRTAGSVEFDEAPQA